MSNFGGFRCRPPFALRSIDVKFLLEIGFILDLVKVQGVAVAELQRPENQFFKIFSVFEVFLGQCLIV